MKSMSYSLLVIAAGSLMLLACSSTPKSESTPPLEKQAQAQPHADTPEAIAQRAADTFSNAPGLNAEQKQKLTAIYAKTYSEAMGLRTQIGQSKSLLFQMLASSDYKSSEVAQLKKKITALDEKRLALMFQALDEVQKVVGYGKNKEEIYKHLRDFEFPAQDRAAAQ